MQTDYKGRDYSEIPDEEKELAKDWLKKISERRDSPEYKRFLAKIPKWRRYVKGTEHQEYDDDENIDNEDVVRANLIASAIANAIPRVYAKDPEISVRPNESVEPIRYTKIERFGLTLQIVLNNQFGPNQARLKKRAKSNLRSGFTTSMGVLKVSYQKDIAEDPFIRGRINDVQDNIKRIETQLKDLEDPELVQEHERIREQLKHEMASLDKQLEVVRAEGLVIDRVLTENHVVSGEVQDSDGYVDSEWQAELIEMSQERCKELFKFCPDKATTYTKSKKPDEQKKGDVHIWEIWHKSGNLVYTLCEGYHGYMRDPFAPKRIGQRWYPYFRLIPLPVDGSDIPNCFVDMLLELQDEYNETRTNFREHRKKNLPFYIGLKGDLTEEDANKLSNPKPYELCMLDGPEGKTIRDVFMEITGNPIQPLAYDVSQIRVDFELVSGQGDAGRGVVAKPKTLGEAEIIEQGLSTRMAELQDENEDMIQEIAQFAAEILLLEMTPQQVQRIVGPGALWPEMSREDVFDMVQIEIKAGSTGKPDRQKEREVWTNFLPVFRETIAQVADMRKNGDEELADAMILLLKETMRRFDERIDVDEYFPVKQEGEIDPQKEQMMMQQQEAMKAQMEEMRARIGNIRADTLNKLADAEAKEIGSQFDMYMEQMNFLTSLMNPAPGAQPRTLQ